MNRFNTVLIVSGASAFIGGVLLAITMVSSGFSHIDPTALDVLIGISMAGIGGGTLGLVGCVLHNECYPRPYRIQADTPLLLVAVSPQANTAASFSLPPAALPVPPQEPVQESDREKVTLSL